MATKKITLNKSSVRANDLASWNFIIFLTLALLLLVILMSAMNGVAKDLRSRAMGICPTPAMMPRAEDCPGGKWDYKRMEDGCEAFICPTRQ